MAGWAGHKDVVVPRCIAPCRLLFVALLLSPSSCSVGRAGPVYAFLSHFARVVVLCASLEEGRSEKDIRGASDKGGALKEIPRTDSLHRHLLLPYLTSYAGRRWSPWQSEAARLASLARLHCWLLADQPLAPV